MFPILFSIGSFHVFSFSIFLILAWFIWSFLFWRHLRALAVAEEPIFDAMFVTTIISLIISRLSFVGTHVALFRENWLRVVALWVQPGLSLYGALIGCVLILIFFAMKYKIRIAHILDAFSVSFMWAFAIGLIGSFLDGSVVGKEAALGWAVPYAGHMGFRHPVQVYQCIAMVFIILIISLIRRSAKKHAWADGIIAMWFFMLFSGSAFGVEFFMEHTVYWGNLSANQWILVGIFGQSLGAFYVRGGGKERVQIWARAVQRISKKVIGGIYAKFSKRHIESN
ncbi:MAG: prolipoprotein diacylglyceryl transferase family protein [Microgenomates group bacterium]